MNTEHIAIDRVMGRRFVLAVVLRLVVGAAGLGWLAGCHDLTNQQLPAGTSDPASFDTPTGAIGMYNAAIVTLEKALPQYIVDSGTLTDELESNRLASVYGGLNGSPGVSLDARILPEGGIEASTSSGPADGDYIALQQVRASISQALGALAAYDVLVADTATVKIRRGELFALEGYAEIMLADLFCSGVPLSTLDFQKDFTYEPGSKTLDVYQAALVAADSAVALASGSDTVMNMARVMQGRALLALGQYAQAAQSVAAVPDGFQYQMAIDWTESTQDFFTNNNYFDSGLTIANNEGINGISYLDGDPRITVQTITGFIGTYNIPAYINQSGFTPFPIANWIEARLIQAEAALQVHDTTTWLTILNTLRLTATTPGQTVTPLATLADPGSSPPVAKDSARVSLMFQERAFWLFLSGHRQGDLRRLIRQYVRPQQKVYPTGPYIFAGATTYGSDVTAPIPTLEFINPLYTGCIDRGA